MCSRGEVKLPAVSGKRLHSPHAWWRWASTEDKIVISEGEVWPRVSAPGMGANPVKKGSQASASGQDVLVDSAAGWTLMYSMKMRRRENSHSTQRMHSLSLPSPPTVYETLEPGRRTASTLEPASHCCLAWTPVWRPHESGSVVHLIVSLWLNSNSCGVNVRCSEGCPCVAGLKQIFINLCIM